MLYRPDVMLGPDVPTSPEFGTSREGEVSLSERLCFRSWCARPSIPITEQAAQAERENDPLMVRPSNHERYPDYVGRTSFSKTENGGLGSESLPPDVTSGGHRGEEQ